MDLLAKVDELLKTYAAAGVSTTAGMSSQVGSPSAEVLLTDGLSTKKKRKKMSKGKSVHKAPEDDASGIITTINGKKLKITGLSDKEKDEYLFGDTKIEKAISYTDMVIEYLSAHQAPELSEEDDGTLEKAEKKASKLVNGKKGVWRRVGGRPCFIGEDGIIHAGPKVFVGKKVATLRDELRAESRAKKSKAKG